MEQYDLKDWDAIMTFFKPLRKWEDGESYLRGYWTSNRKNMDMCSYDFERGWSLERDHEMQDVMYANSKIVPMLYELMKEQKDAEIRKRANLVISKIRRK